MDKDSNLLEKAWEKVRNNGERVSAIHLRDYLINESNNVPKGQRFKQFSRNFSDILFDFSKEKIDGDSLNALIELARASDVIGMRNKMFAGEAINSTENRAVLHVAARDPDTTYNGVAEGEVSDQTNKFLTFAQQVRDGEFRAANGEKFTDVISIGIGGSNLGPAMAVKALSPYGCDINIHFVGNVDGADFIDVAKGLSPETTLIIIQSKTFTTTETLTNARSALRWLQTRIPQLGITNHLVAVSSNVPLAVEFGIDPTRIFGFWDWIGGRYSIWSAIGLPLAIYIGADSFRELLAGAHEVDQHFFNADIVDNVPILLGLIGIWRRNILGYTSVAVIPYEERLARMPAYLQQLMMESNGKSVSRDNQRVDYRTCPVIWGEAGTNAQHSFFQMLHQGTDIIPVDFLIAREPTTDLVDHHKQLLANCFAQSSSLAIGRTYGEVKQKLQNLTADSEKNIPHRTFEGDRPSTTIIYQKLVPSTLGKIIALYEHKTFVEAAIWNINAFDQWGVELGKELALSLVDKIGSADTETDNFDESTNGLLQHISKSGFYNENS